MSQLLPSRHLVPKQETAVTQFLQANPEYNGRNVRVGILDTGIDPGCAAALGNGDNTGSNSSSGTTSTPISLIDVIDCTGSGDVDVSVETTATMADDGSCFIVTGLTGRTLQLSKDWKYAAFPTTTATSDRSTAATAAETTDATLGDIASATAPKSESTKVPIRLGWKRAYELFPSKLQSRVNAERRTTWEAAVAKHTAIVRAKLAQLQATNEPKDPTDAAEHKNQVAEWQARLDILIDKQWTTDDPGPLLDCVVFHDGKHYQAVVASDDWTKRDMDSSDGTTQPSASLSASLSDSGNTLDLTRYTPLTSYALRQQHGTLGVLDQLNFAVQFYQDGRILSLVTDASPHGTHVAGITTGVAPGCEVVSFKIGDSRLGSMETGAAVVRALKEAIVHKCHVINMSYGEGCQVPNAGRFVELAQELVYKHGITFVSSAGNNGPALSTVGAPGGTSSALLGIAAYVSPIMQQVLYSMPIESQSQQDIDHINENNDRIGESSTIPPNVYGDEQHPGSTFTWSSVGPTTDGDWGVNLTAPGGAITTVSNWCLQKSQLMNGTSMSSPHAAGCVALLQSACLSNGMSISPNLLRQALLNTAQTLPNLSICQQGAGMINVPAAWEYLQKFHNIFPDVHYHVAIENLSGSPRGVYLRQPHETSVPLSLAVSIDPQWRRQDVTTRTAQQEKIAYETHFTITSTAPGWVKTPAHFILMNNGRSFKIDVDPSQLPPGLHTAQVLGVDANHPDAGPLFRVPITVTKPMPLPEDTTTLDLGVLSFTPAETKRFFVVPPLGATWMDVVLTDMRQPSEEAYTKLYALHTVQLLPHAAYRDFEQAKYFNLHPGQTTVTSIAVEAGVTAEIDVGRYWSTLGAASLKVQVHFRGIRPVPNHVQMMCGDAGSLVRLVSDLADESIMPAAKLTKWSTALRPKENPILQPLGPRDVFPSHDKEIYQLLLTYEFTQDEKGSFTPRVPTTQGVLYESGLESQLIMVYDGDKKLLGSADAWPSSVSAPKGKVVLRMQIRHDNPENLDALKDMPLWIERSIDKEITLSVFDTREAMVLGKSNFRKRTLRKGCTAAVFFQEPSASNLPSGCKAGDVLKGTFTIGSGEVALMGDGKRPKGFPITYTVGPKPTKASDPDPIEAKEERTVQESLDDAIRDLKVAKLDELTSKDKEEGKFELLYDDFIQQYPKHLPLLMSKLRYLDAHPKRKDRLTDIIASANAVLAEIEEDALAMYFGRKSDLDDPKANKLKKEMKEKKSFLVEALARSAMAHCETDTEASKTKLDQIFKRIKAWVDIDSDKQYFALCVEREKRAGRYGLVVKAINRILSKEIKEKDFLYPTSKSTLMEERAAALDKLGYAELVDRDRKMRAVACPASYALF